MGWGSTTFDKRANSCGGSAGWAALPSSRAGGERTCLMDDTRKGVRRESRVQLRNNTNTTRLTYSECCFCGRRLPWPTNCDNVAPERSSSTRMWRSFSSRAFCSSSTRCNSAAALPLTSASSTPTHTGTSQGQPSRQHTRGTRGPTARLTHLRQQQSHKSQTDTTRSTQLPPPQCHG